MKSIFPKYTLLCRPKCSEQEIIERIENGLENNKSRFRIKSKRTQNPRFTIISGTGSRIYYNSFMPVITIDIVNSDVLLTAQLHKSIKIGLSLFVLLFCMLFVLPAVFFAEIQAVIFLLLMFFIFSAFAYVMARLCLKRASREVLYDFYEIINLEYTTNVTITKI